MKDPLRLATSSHPIVYEIDARSWLVRLSRQHGRRVRLGSLPDEALEPIVASGADALWLMGVWRTGPAGRRVARSRQSVVERAQAILPDFRPEDIAGSPYAVMDYVVAAESGGEDGLAALRARLAGHGVGLILDFVPNHTAVDHRWVRHHPDWYVQADTAQATREPGAWLQVRVNGRTRWSAHGRDPNFPPWSDTAQLDYRLPEVHAAMTDLLGQLALRCDGVRCDMAMLVLGDVFRTTWGAGDDDAGAGRSNGEFWWHALRQVPREPR